MVLSPMDPVAPSTVTVRAPDNAALLLRNGTALIVSPNHKTAADAIGTTAQEPENGRQDDGCDKPIQPVHQPAMAGNHVAGILDPETPLHGGFEEIAELRGDRENSGLDQQRDGPAEVERRKSAGHGEAGGKTAHRPGPGLLGTDTRPEFRAADAAASEIAAAIGDPDDEQHE